MFNGIAAKYDLMNAVMTLGQDGRWRRLAANETGLKAGDRVLDVACGTGDMARELVRRVSPGGEVVGIDIAQEMLDIARVKTVGLPIRFEEADVYAMGFNSEFDAATVAFGFRNFADRPAAIRSMACSLKPGGRLVVLELAPSRSRLRPFIEFYEARVIPFIASWLAANHEAYQYLPRSVAVSTTALEIKYMLNGAGLQDVESRELNFGTVAVVWGTKRPASSASME